MIKNIFRLAVLFVSVFVISCVPLSKFNEMKNKSDNCSQENEKLKSDVEKLTVDNKELASQKESLITQHDQLVKDSTDLHNKLDSVETEYNKLDQQHRALQVAQDELTRGNARETAKLMSQLQTAQDNLEKKGNELKKLEFSLDEKRRNLDLLTAELDKRNKKVKEMEAILNRKDSVVNALKSKVTDALLGFEKDGLSVNVKNGKVYVSLDEKLLFQSGKYEVNQSGASALKKLSKVLEQNEDINVMIEGHTDDVPYRGEGSLIDNWDLSVKRATAVVRILLQGSGIEPQRFTVAGRSQYVPVDKSKTAEARQKNRRTEIILTPKLDELFKILESN